ncbi:MAG TPA: carbohydrate ABC transporter permease [Candidatus Rifleibacterium sp.]|nr:carbohydrate ABC transporter permease [Candidatus Rifleibacterium sp.]HPT45805.1 carbohydrate ABC transporter permease [Candidatus Rifleibacterium sp.]
MFKFKHPDHVPVHTLLIIGSIFMLFPFIWMIATSFKSQDEILSTSKKIVLLPDLARPGFLNGAEEKARINRKNDEAAAWQAEQAKPAAERNQKIRAPFQWLDNYLFALRAQPFYRFFLNTIFVSITVTSVSLFFASLAAYAFAFFNFPFKNTMFMLMLGTMMLPQQALLIPNYIVLSKIGWVNSYLALIVPWFASAYAVFFLRQFFMQLPKDLFEAATIDGCSRFQFYYKVVLPLSIPSMVTLGIFSFLANWNSFVWPLIVTNDTNLRVIQVGLSYFSSEAGTKWGPLMAASTMTILPLVIGYFLAQKQFVESQATTGMKE